MLVITRPGKCSRRPKHHRSRGARQNMHKNISGKVSGSQFEGVRRAKRRFLKVETSGEKRGVFNCQKPIGAVWISMFKWNHVPFFFSFKHFVMARWHWRFREPTVGSSIAITPWVAMAATPDHGILWSPVNLQIPWCNGWGLHPSYHFKHSIKNGWVAEVPSRHSNWLRDHQSKPLSAWF